jgi:acyl-CoA hydrolase
MYNSKKSSIEEALSIIKSGDVIYPSTCPMYPMTILSGLNKVIVQNKLENLTIVTGGEQKEDAFSTDPACQGKFEHVSLSLMGVTRKLLKEKRVSYVPTDLSNITTRSFLYRKPTVGIIACTPMDEYGYVRCSLSQVIESELVATAERLIAEVNPNYPFVGGDTAIHISRFDKLIETDAAIPKIPRGEPSDVEKTIGNYVAELINDGDTIQLGIGGIPDAVALGLMSKHDLGIHSEMISNSMANLIEAGVVNGRKKPLDNGKVVGGFAFGDQKLYDTMNNNPAIEIRRVSYVNDPFVISRLENVVSCNSCVTLDLTAQICSESIGHFQFSGTGGASDFAYGVSRAKNGRGIIAVQSTAKNGEVSTIVPVLPAGQIVSIRRNNIDYIITEYGVAPMKGRSVKERVNNLVGVAHPKFRDWLKEEATKAGLI